MQYRKKPVIIHAVQWLPGVSLPGVETGIFLVDQLGGPDTPAAIVETLEGRMMVRPGDMVITGVAGERYPCKPEIFEATYEVEPACKCSKPEPTTISGLYWRCSSCELLLSPLKVLGLYRDGVLDIAEGR